MDIKLRLSQLNDLGLRKTLRASQLPFNVITTVFIPRKYDDNELTVSFW